ncbi:hypothetical protein [Bacillus sp. LL01]|uniref:hypothetical protein n=1 Tax=Bacillus sp. LL01 TaxID=1665556 RepID=UPI000FFE700D|nr:hypothetical protein [Bacillus sp. LL01]
MRNLLILLTLSVSLTLSGCTSSKASVAEGLELVSADGAITANPSITSYDTSEGEEAILPEYYLEYSFLISSEHSIGSEHEMLSIEFIPSDELAFLLGEDTFKVNYSSSGIASLGEDEEGEFILVFGLEKEFHENNTEGILNILGGTLVLKEGHQEIKRFTID